MKWLEMIEGSPTPATRTYVMREFLGLRAQRGGLLLNRKKLGDLVKAGDILCSIVDIYGDEVESIVAPEDGIFVRTTTLSTVSRGERAATLGLL